MGYAYELKRDERLELLRIARATLREHVRSGRIPPGKPHRACMLAPAAVIATLRSQGGASVRMSSRNPAEALPLYQAVQRAVIGAASEDPRLEPLSDVELEEVDIELAVLGSSTVAPGPAAIEVGTHGLIVAIGGRRAVLLPTLPIDGGLDAEAFLARACEHIGLEPNAWRRDDAVIEVFSAQVFSERSS